MCFDLLLNISQSVRKVHNFHPMMPYKVQLSQSQTMTNKIHFQILIYLFIPIVEKSSKVEVGLQLKRDYIAKNFKFYCFVLMKTYGINYPTLQIIV